MSSDEEGLTTSDSLYESQQLFECPISSEIMHNAVSTPCGHTFEESSIKEYLERNPICPSCRQPVEIKSLAPNYVFRDLISDYKEKKLKKKKNKDKQKIDDDRIHQELQNRVMNETALRYQEEQLRKEEEAKRKEEEAKRKEEEAKRKEEEAKRKEEEAKRLQIEEDLKRREAELTEARNREIKLREETRRKLKHKEAELTLKEQQLLEQDKLKQQKTQEELQKSKEELEAYTKQLEHSNLEREKLRLKLEQEERRQVLLLQQAEAKRKEEEDRRKAEELKRKEDEARRKAESERFRNLRNSSNSSSTSSSSTTSSSSSSTTKPPPYSRDIHGDPHDKIYNPTSASTSAISSSSSSYWGRWWSGSGSSADSNAIIKPESHYIITEQRGIFSPVWRGLYQGSPVALKLINFRSGGGLRRNRRKWDVTAAIYSSSAPTLPSSSVTNTSSLISPVSSQMLAQSHYSYRRGNGELLPEGGFRESEMCILVGGGALSGGTGGAVSSVVGGGSNPASPAPPTSSPLSASHMTCSCLFQNEEMFREVMILYYLSSSMKHPHLLQVQGVLCKRDHLNSGAKRYYMALTPFVDYDLEYFIADLIHKQNRATVIHSIMFQLTVAVSYLHASHIVHRDLKPTSIMVSKTTQTQIWLCSFQYARSTLPVTTVSTASNPSTIALKLDALKEESYMGYRAPELVLSAGHVQQDWNEENWRACDIWSIGCIFAQLLLGEPLFSGTGRDKILESIFSFKEMRKSLGKLTDRFGALSSHAAFEKEAQFSLKNLLADSVDEDGLDLLQKMLMVDPKLRISIVDILYHPYFMKNVKCESTMTNPKNQAWRGVNIELAKLMRDSQLPAFISRYCPGL